MKRVHIVTGKSVLLLDDQDVWAVLVAVFITVLTTGESVVKAWGDGDWLLAVAFGLAAVWWLWFLRLVWRSRHRVSHIEYPTGVDTGSVGGLSPRAEQGRSGAIASDDALEAARTGDTQKADSFTRIADAHIRMSTIQRDT